MRTYAYILPGGRVEGWTKKQPRCERCQLPADELFEDRPGAGYKMCLSCWIEHSKEVHMSRVLVNER